MTAPRVSIVMNVRDGAGYLRESIESARAQTFRDWELILFDNHSIDESAEIAASFGDDRVRYVYLDRPVSLGEARKRAIRLATADWIAFLDQDDVWMPDKLEKQLALEAPDVGLIYGRSIRFGRGRRERDFDHLHEFAPLPEGDIFLRLFSESCFIAMSSAMVRRSAVREAGGIPGTIGIIPDYYLFVAVARRYRARAVQEVVCRYREHSGNMTRASFRAMQQEAAWIVDHWSHALPPELARKRKAVHETLVALADIRDVRTLGQGLSRFITSGSPSFLFSRPFVRMFRAARRRIRTPYWRTVSPPCGRLPAGGRARRIRVIGTDVSVLSFASAMEELAERVRRKAGVYVSPANAYSVALAHEDAGYQRVLNAADVVTADGMSIVLALKALGATGERVHNDDLFLACCRRFGEWSHFLVGGRTGQPEEVAAEMSRRFPGIRIVGKCATPVRPVPPEQTERILAEIRGAKPSIVWVGMGTPAQDQWMANAAPFAGVPMVGVGSAFDMLSGRTRPAPEWIKRNGLQWLFRLWQEPRRLLSRYAYYNTRFLIALGCQLMAGGRASPRGRAPRIENPRRVRDLDLSVVIVSHNVAHLLGDCLESLARECAGQRFEVFVVDSASTDGTVDLVRRRFPEVRLRACGENIGFSAGNNVALRECRGRHVLLLNPDTIVHQGAIRGLMRHMDEYPAAGAAGPTLRLPGGEVQHECAQNAPRIGNVFPWLLLLDKLEWHLRFRGGARPAGSHPPRGTLLDRFSLLSWARDRTCAVELVCGACMMIRGEALEKVGFLDESSPLYLDDVDYCRRLRDAGWEVHYVAGPTVTHYWQRSTSQLRRAGDVYAMGCHAIWLYLRKHDGRTAGTVFSAMACIASAARVAASLAGLALPGATRRAAARRQLQLGLGLARWAFRYPKTQPLFGFQRIKTPESPASQAAAELSR